MNIVILIGRLGRDPDIRVTESGLTIARFSIAIDRPPQKDGTKVTDWPNIVCFGRTAELVSTYIKKGSQIGIEGRIQTGSYKNKEGQTVWTTEVIANRVQFLDKKNTASNLEPTPVMQDNNQNRNSQDDIPDSLEKIDTSDTDLPF
ncbi:MAG: single-stranded DNA-binding protein [Clostridiales Family XIII bacterium]|jgi:single-strand DNA-binding protein|nr:single-stranded DNA-binding protein [Clostridiales Family XIII bacterium]